MAKVSSCQYLNDNSESVRLYKNSSTNDLSYEISNIKHEVNKLMKRNASLSKVESE